MSDSLAFMIVAVTVTGCITAIMIVRSVLSTRKHRIQEQPHDLDVRLSDVERRLQNLETITTSREFTLQKELDALARD